MNRVTGRIMKCTDLIPRSAYRSSAGVCRSSCTLYNMSTAALCCTNASSMSWWVSLSSSCLRSSSCSRDAIFSSLLQQNPKPLFLRYMRHAAATCNIGTVAGISYRHPADPSGLSTQALLFFVSLSLDAGSGTANSYCRNSALPTYSCAYRHQQFRFCFQCR